MKALNKYKLLVALVGLIPFFSSCSEEEPFNISDDNGSLVKFSMSVNQTVTRAVEDKEKSELLQNCKFTISDSKGLLYNWKSYEEIPAEGIFMKYGDYIAAASAGDSVPASFTKRFFRGITNFKIQDNQVSTRVSVICRLANVVATVDASALSEEERENLKVVIKSVSDELEFSGNSLSLPGYFMRKYNSSTGKYDNQLSYTLTGVSASGDPFEKSGVIEGIQPAHEYRIVIEKNDKVGEDFGGAVFKISIKEYQLQDLEVTLQGKPNFDFSLASNVRRNQLVVPQSGDIEDQTIIIGAYEEFRNLMISSNDAKIKEVLQDNIPIDFLIVSSQGQRLLEDLGIVFEKFITNTRSENSMVQYRITLKSKFLENFRDTQNRHRLSITATDQRGYTNTCNISITAVEPAPFEIVDSYWKTDYMAVRAHSAQVKLNILEGASDVVMQYRKKGEEDWMEIPVNNSKTGDMIVKISGLESNHYPQSGVTYECRAVSGKDLESGDYNLTTEIYEFTTETIFDLPNAGMEDWYKSGKVWEPALSKDVDTFWDTGNHGSTAISQNDNLSVSESSIKHSGNYSAALNSKFVGLLGVGAHGAGNIFTGKFMGTSGMNGKLDLGREFNYSHPSKLRLWVKYCPATSTKAKNNNYIKKNAYDEGQIYIAVSNAIHRVDTSNPSTLVSPDNLPSAFLAYGQRSFTINDADFGDYQENVFSDEKGGLKMVEIPFEYFEKANTMEPKYLIIVCAASKYGDYFEGGEGTVMYVDDFELVYDD